MTCKDCRHAGRVRGGDAVGAFDRGLGGVAWVCALSVIAAMPAGLAAAFYLRMLGHDVTVFEARDEAGGMLRYALPEYRLPKAVLRRELNIIERLGVRFVFGQPVGTRKLIEELQAEFDAIFLAVGTWKAATAGIPDEDAPGSWHAIHFLEQVARGGAPEIGPATIVIGGGNAAVDSARTAARLGARVTVVYRRAREDMPAIPEEIDDAIAEGVEFRFHAAPRRVLRRDDGRVRGIEFSLTEPGEFDASGRRKPVPTGERLRLECTTLVFATGERPDSAVFRSAGIRDGYLLDFHGIAENLLEDIFYSDQAVDLNALVQKVVYVFPQPVRQGNYLQPGNLDVVASEVPDVGGGGDQLSQDQHERRGENTGGRVDQTDDAHPGRPRRPGSRAPRRWGGV